MKQCKKCNLFKEESEFDKRKDGRISGHCKECRREALRQHYKSNKDYYKKKARGNDKYGIKKSQDYKKLLSCTDCGISFKDEPYLCDFHHLDSSTKEANVGNLTKSFVQFKKEAEKCIPLCANCHRRRHHKQD